MRESPLPQRGSRIVPSPAAPPRRGAAEHRWRASVSSVPPWCCSSSCSFVCFAPSWLHFLLRSDSQRYTLRHLEDVRVGDFLSGPRSRAWSCCSLGSAGAFAQQSARLKRPITTRSAKASAERAVHSLGARRLLPSEASSDAFGRRVGTAGLRA